MEQEILPLYLFELSQNDPFKEAQLCTYLTPQGFLN